MTGVSGTLGVPITSSDGRPSLAPDRTAITCTVYSVPLSRLSIAWLVVEPDETVACRVAGS